MGAHHFEDLVVHPTVPHPGVKFPPPLLFVATFLAGWLLHRQWPVPILPPRANTVREVAGALLVAIGIALILWALATFRHHRTAVFPNRPASRIVRDGPYRFTRNPMYVSLTLIYFGLSLLVNSVLPLLFLPIALVLLVRLVIAREEHYLRSAFEEEYAAYTRDVRRWL